MKLFHMVETFEARVCLSNISVTRILKALVLAFLHGKLRPLLRNQFTKNIFDKDILIDQGGAASDLQLRLEGLLRFAFFESTKFVSIFAYPHNMFPAIDTNPFDVRQIRENRLRMTPTRSTSKENAVNLDGLV
jgi:hypothetical protein